jgi:hypothetical protein
LKDPQYRVQLLPYKDEAGGRPAVGVGVFKGPMARDLSLFLHFDKETGLLLREKNNHSESEIVYEDYRTFDGFPMARRTTHKVRGVLTGKGEVIEFQVRDGFDPKLFQRP